MAVSHPSGREGLPAAIERISPYVRAIGEFRGDEGTEPRPRVLDGYQLEYVCEGAAEYRIEGGIRAAEAGDAVLIPPQTPYQRTAVKGRLLVYRTIHFDFVCPGAQTQPADWEWMPNPILVQHPQQVKRTRASTSFAALMGLPVVSRMGHCPEFAPLWTRLFTELYRKDCGYQLAVKACMTEILLHLYRGAGRDRTAASEPERTALPPAVEHGKRYIESHFAYRISLASLAREAHHHPVYFERLFKKHVGCTPFEYLTWVRVDRSKEFLAHSHLNLTEVAAEVGFPSVQRFSSAFRRLAGCPPREYRRDALRSRQVPLDANPYRSFPVNVLIGHEVEIPHEKVAFPMVLPRSMQ